MVMAKPIAMSIAMPATAGMKYWSETDGVVVAVGACVGAFASTLKVVTACEGQYDSEPPNEAYTVNLPSMSGFQVKLKKPSRSLVTLPISR